MAEFRSYASPEIVAQAAADYLYQQISQCVSAKERCHVVLPGGSTPARCLQLLAEKPLPWQKIHWYPSDERCYPSGHAERNDTMILATLFALHKEASDNFHPIAAELGPEQGAENYSALLDATGGMDIVLLGMGEDGHTASLFPGNPAVEDMNSAVPVYHAPKPPQHRVSIGLTILANAQQRIVIATGDSKREALQHVNAGGSLPVAMVNPDVWFIDESAMPA